MKTKNTQSTLITHQEQKPKEIEKKPEKTLIIRLQQEKPKPRVSWTEDTIDNQHMNKMKSNLCCIYRRPGDSSSDTCTSDDEGNALERDRHTKKLHKKKCSKNKNKNKKKEEEDPEKHEHGSQCKH